MSTNERYFAKAENRSSQEDTIIVQRKTKLNIVIHISILLTMFYKFEVQLTILSTNHLLVLI